MVYKVFEHFVAYGVAAAIENAKRKAHKKTEKNKESFRKNVPCVFEILWYQSVVK